MLDFLKGYLRITSWPIIAAMAALLVVGVLAVSTAEEADPHTLQGYTQRQVEYALVAAAAFLAATFIPYHRLGRAAYLWFGLTLALLVLVLFLPPIRECHRWIDLKYFLVQPSEIAKVTYVLALAWYLRYRQNYRRLPGLLPPFLLTLAPVLLIFKEPDLGTSLLLFPTLFFMLLMAGARVKHLLAVVGVAAVVLFLPVPQSLAGLEGAELADRKALAYWSFSRGDKEYVVAAAPLVFMKAHQLSRVDGWLRQSDPRVAAGKNDQVRRSIIVVGSGGAAGNPDGDELAYHLSRLPEDQTDFIYAVVGGQWGFAGTVGVLLVYGVIILCGVEIAVLTHDPFGRLLVVGVLALLFSQVFTNIGMTIGLLPVTGMTLPLVSYGGSSMVVNGFALGMLVNVGMRRPVFFAGGLQEGALED